MTLDDEIRTMLLSAREAGALALQHFSSKIVMEEKADLSPVTIADRECEQVISAHLDRRFPDDGILGEEGALKSSHSGRRWLIDPIDGTRDFVRGNDFWSVQIALQSEERVVMGAICFPRLHSMLYAVEGGGCFWNEVPARHPGQANLEKAILMISGMKAAWEVWPADAVRSLSERCWTVRGYGAGYDIAMLALGHADIWLSGSGKEWDYAAARIIAQECGVKFLVKDGSDRIDAGHCVLFPPGLERELRTMLQIQNRT